MKILILTGNFPPDVGGPARMLDHLIRDLLGRGLKVSVLTSAPSDSRKYSYRVYRVSRKLFKPLRLLLSLIYGALLSLSADVLYVADIYSAGQAWWAKKILGKKIIIRFVSDPVWDTARAKGWIEDSFEEFQKGKLEIRNCPDGDPLREKLGLRIEKMKKRRDRILKSADKIITCSNFLQDHLVGIGIDEKKIKVIYNSVEKLGFEVSKSPEEIKSELGIEGKMLITNPRLVPWKSVGVLTQAVSEINRQGPLRETLTGREDIPDLGYPKSGMSLSLVVLGEGSEEWKLKKLVKELGLEDRVFVLGKKLGQEFIDLMNAADIFVYNTSYEGMSHAILDVMQLGKPIITTNISPNKEILKDGEDALLVEYNNLESWVGAIKKLLDDEGLGGRMVESYRGKMGRFSWDRLVEETVGVLEEVKNQNW